MGEKIKFTGQHNNGRNYADDKETVLSLTAVAIASDGKIKQPVKIRCYKGRSSSANCVYCSVWVGYYNFHTSGHGSAGGYGYCKKSAAMSDALESAGILLNYSINGRGESAMERAMIDICRELGFTGEIIIVRG